VIFNRTPAAMIAAARPWHPRDTRFLGLIALALVLIALHLGEGLDLAARAGSGHRVIDRQALERRIEAGELRDREALWFHQARPEETSGGGRAP
jgi:hypothetical protein